MPQQRRAQSERFARESPLLEVLLLQLRPDTETISRLPTCFQVLLLQLPTLEMLSGAVEDHNVYRENLEVEIAKEFVISISIQVYGVTVFVISILIIYHFYLFFIQDLWVDLQHHRHCNNCPRICL